MNLEIFRFLPCFKGQGSPSPKRKSPPKPTEIDFQMACLCLTVHKATWLVLLGASGVAATHGAMTPPQGSTLWLGWVAPGKAPRPGFWPGWTASDRPLNKHLPSPLLGWWSNWIMPFLFQWLQSTCWRQLIIRMWPYENGHWAPGRSAAATSSCTALGTPPHKGASWAPWAALFSQPPFLAWLPALTPKTARPLVLGIPDRAPRKPSGQLGLDHLPARSLENHSPQNWHCEEIHTFSNQPRSQGSLG